MLGAVGAIAIFVLLITPSRAGEETEETTSPIGSDTSRLSGPTSSTQNDPGPDEPAQLETANGDADTRPVSRVIEGLDSVDNSVFALGSVWAVTSNHPDEFSPGPIEASVVRIDPSTGQVAPVLDSPGIEPTFAELDGRLWVRLVDRLVALDPNGAEVESIPLTGEGPVELVAGNGWLWTVATDDDQVSVIDPSTAAVVRTIETGDFPAIPIAAFGFVWIPGLIDGTMTIVDVDAPGDLAVSSEFVTSRPKNVTAVPDGATGDELWVSNIDGQIHAISAEADDFAEVRQVIVDRPINRMVVFEDRAFLLPTWGRNVLVFDLKTDTLLAEIPIDSIPVRAVVAHDLVWVTGDGTDETLTAIDPDSLTVRGRFKAGSGESDTNGPQQPFAVDNEIWVPNRGDDAFFIVELGQVTAQPGG